jgi:PAS domain S-box-containing protein
MNTTHVGVQRTISLSLVLVGLYVLFGWAFGQETMVRVMPSSVAMGVNAAGMFVVTGLCLFPVDRHHLFSRLQRSLPWILVALSCLILMEHALDLGLGVDLPALHSIVKDGNPRPGRVSPNACFAFLTTGIALILLTASNASKFSRATFAVLSGATLITGSTALLGYELGLEEMYRLAQYNRMAAPTAAAITLMGIGLWLRLPKNLSSGVKDLESPDKHVTRVAAIVLTIVTVLTGLVGFSVLKQGFEKSLSDSLLRSTKNFAASFETAINQKMDSANVISTRPALQSYLLRINAEPKSHEAHDLIVGVAKSFLTKGLSGIRVVNAKGEDLVALGTMAREGAMVSIPLKGSAKQAVLLWNDGFILWIETPIVHEGQVIGKVVVEQQMTALTKMLVDAQEGSESIDMLICGRDQNDALCFPSRFYTTSYRIPMYKDGVPNLAIPRALLSQQGVLKVRDLRGVPVLAGYAPVGNLGLGMVVKTDSFEFYTPIRERLNLLAGLLFCMIVLATLILRSQIQPLARRMHQDQQRMRVIIDSAHEAFIEMDKIGQITDWNIEAEHTFGWTREEALGQDLANLIIPSAMREAHRQGMARYMEVGEGPVLGKRIELVALHRNGTHFSIEITISALKENNEYRFTAFLHDITDRKQTESDLLAAKLQAETANLAKGTFLANMSHEIRTPMNAVLGMLQLVQKTELNARQQDYVSKSQSAAKSLLGLLNDILDFSKMDAGKLQLDRHAFEIEELMRDLAVVLSGIEGNTDVEVIFEIDPQLPPVLWGDRLRLQQIFINLAGNAVKFTQHGQVVIRLTQLARAANKLTLRVEIIDTGIGMSPEQQTRIFDGFTQAEASTTRRFGGTGLGLVISQRLVALMGGNLSVESALGNGSRFWFDITLPVESVSAARMVPTDLPQDLRVLVVEDNALSREILTKTLETMGWTVDAVSDGETGVRKVRHAQTLEAPYDVVLMDWRMPGMDGLDAATTIQQSLPGSKLPIIIMVTAFGRDVLAEAAALPHPPFIDFLTKPVTSQQLVTAIQRALVGQSLQMRQVPAMSAAIQRLHGVRILLVEDNALNRQIATELLQAEGAHIEVAEGGLKGVSMATARANAYDAIIMDVQMPDLDGLEATRRIRAHAHSFQLPILAMTANASSADRSDCLAAGMNDHVAKPIDIEVVVARVLSLLGPATHGVHAQSTALDVSAAIALLEPQEVILRRLGQKLEVFHMALSGFKAECLRAIAELRIQVEANNLAQAGAAMHALKGVASTLGAVTLAKLAADLEQRAKTEKGIDAGVLFSEQVVAELTDLAHCSEAALVATMPPNPAKMELPDTNDLAVLPDKQLVAKLLEIQTLLQERNLRAIDMVQELLSLTSGADKIKAQGLLDITERLQFQAAQKTVQSWVEGLH